MNGPVGLQEASDRLVRTVDSLGDDELASPSVLPGWKRAHVVAHLALNAEGLSRAFEGVTKGRPAPIYDSVERRDTDIEELAGGTSSELRERLLAGVARFADATERVVGDQAQAPVERTPGGPRLPVTVWADKRWVEVEVHHVDLDAGYSAADWPEEFGVHLLTDFTRRRPHWRPGFVAAPAEVDRTWELGTTDTGSPRVTGPLRQLVWWLTGRGDGSGLTSTTGVLPEIGKW